MDSGTRSRLSVATSLTLVNRFICDKACCCSALLLVFWVALPAPCCWLCIFGEEKLLARNLEGYQEYLGKTRYRLLPHVW